MEFLQKNMTGENKMKKIFALMLCVVMMFCFSISSSAHWVDEKEMGITFSFPDTWEKTLIDDGFSFSNKSNQMEVFEIGYVDTVNGTIDFLTEEECRQLAIAFCSNDVYASVLSEANNTRVTVRSNYEEGWYEYYNGVKYYKYQKNFTASASGYYDLVFYTNNYFTIKNNKIYVFMHSRTDENNRFSDVINLLNTISYENGLIKININGDRIYPDSDPVIIEGRTMVPIRAVAEKMGYNVGWNAEHGLVTLTSYNTGDKIEIIVGSDVAYKNGNIPISLDVQAFIVGGRTYLPLRAVAEAMDADVNWDPDTRTVDIDE